VQGQGWGGTWERTYETRRILRDGVDTTAGGDVLASGRFDPGGAPTVDGPR
jgi:hypothetical protein